MRQLLVCAAVFFVLASCKTESKKEVLSNPEKLTVSEKIAKAHGIDAWNKVYQLDFTFNVDQDTLHFERSWSWKPKANEVVLTTETDSIAYNRQETDSIVITADRGFINDKYWLLAPFNLVWDKGIKEKLHTEKATAPISGESLQKLTIVYADDAGGYTPGDAYDFYFGDDYLIKEWVFRKGNAPEPGLITTWEDYSDFNGLKIAKTRVRNKGNWKLYFTGIKATPAP
jgi:hypothetical protein